MKNPIALLDLFASTMFAIDSNSYNYFNFFNSYPDSASVLLFTSILSNLSLYIEGIITLL